MKFTITMKDPDGFSDCVEAAVREEVVTIPGLDERERRLVRDERVEKVRGLLKKWFQYDEYLTVEIDTEAKTIRVIEE